MNNILKKVRTERGMSVSELARRTGLSRATIFNIENGISVPLGTTMHAISEALDKEMNEVFFTRSVIRE